jgi:hypothetical protein
MNNKQSQQLYDEHEVAKITNRSVQTLRNDRHNRRGIPYIKFGRSVRYSIEDIQAYIHTHKISFADEVVS